MARPKYYAGEEEDSAVCPHGIDALAYVGEVGLLW